MNGLISGKSASFAGTTDRSFFLLGDRQKMADQ